MTRNGNGARLTPNIQANTVSLNPATVERNRVQQHQRDEHRKIRDLVKNNLAFDVSASISKVFVIGPAAADLAKNNLAQSKLLIYQAATLPGLVLQRTT